jgi:hypothetical protein
MHVIRMLCLLRGPYQARSAGINPSHDGIGRYPVASGRPAHARDMIYPRAHTEDERGGRAVWIQVSVTSDFICPWCYIGEKRLAIVRAKPAETVRQTIIEAAGRLAPRPARLRSQT